MLNRIICSIAILLIVSSCAHKITADDFVEKKTIVVARINLTYSNSKVDVGRGLWNSCNVYASYKENILALSPIKNDYISIVMDEEVDEFFIKGLHCSSYRVLYLKSRNYVLQNELAFKIRPGAINYIGDIDLVWNPKMYFSYIGDYLAPGLDFQGYFNTAHFDDGESQLRVTNKFQEAKNYLMQEFKVDAARIVDRSMNDIFIKNQ